MPLAARPRFSLRTPINGETHEHEFDWGGVIPQSALRSPAGTSCCGCIGRCAVHHHQLGGRYLNHQRFQFQFPDRKHHRQPGKLDPFCPDEHDPGGSEQRSDGYQFDQSDGPDPGYAAASSPSSWWRCAAVREFVFVVFPGGQHELDHRRPWRRGGGRC